MDAIKKCLPFLGAPANDDRLVLSEKKSLAYGTFNKELAVITRFIETLRTSNANEDQLCSELFNLVSATGVSGGMAYAILDGVRGIMDRGLKVGPAMANAIKKAVAVAQEFPKEYPFYSRSFPSSIVAVGVLVIYAPLPVLRALGLTTSKPRYGSFAEVWMSTIAKKHGAVPREAIYAYIKRLGEVRKMHVDE